MAQHPDPVETFDVVVIGAGPVGENVADYAIRGSDRTAALVEAELFGGECSYYACMPSKALLRPLDVTAAANHLPGIQHPVELDRDALLARRDDWVSHYKDAGQERWVRSAGIEPVRGRGRIVGERTVRVECPNGAVRVLEARQAVVVATGSTPVVPEELRGIRPWTSRDATGVREVPERLAVVGGGVVAVESARWLAALGSEVHLLVRGHTLLAAAEPLVGRAVAQGLERSGVVLHRGTAVTAASRPEPDTEAGLGQLHGGTVRLELQGPAGTGLLDVEEVLVATGRKPALSDLGLEQLGLDLGDLDGVVRGDPLPEWLYLVGDASGEPPLTHWGKYRARMLGRSLAEKSVGGTREGAFAADGAQAPVPQVVFSEPQAAWVGLTAGAARAAGHSVEVREVPFQSAAGAALLRDDAEGTVRLVSDHKSGRLLGATFLGPEVAELLHAATVAITGGMTLSALAHAVPSYPTASEVWLRALESEPLAEEG